MKPPPFPETEFLALHERLATTPGPSLAEEPRRDLILSWLDQQGLPGRVDDAGNVWIALGPPGPWDQTLVLDAHYDVVERGYAAALRREGDKLIGLGVADNLVAVAMLLFLARSLHPDTSKRRRPLALLLSVGEEGLGNLKGVRQVVDDHPHPPHAFIAFDLNLETYSTSALGSTRYRAAVTCPGGHSWGSFGSPNAIEQLVGFLAAVRRAFDTRLASKSAAVSFNIGTITGGEGINSIARRASATFEFRSPDPAMLGALDDEVQGFVHGFNPRPDVTLDIEVIGRRPAAPPVQPQRLEPLVVDLLTRITGTPPHSAPRSTNINVPLAAGWPALCTGLCRCGHYHREDEYVELSSLETGWRYLNELADALDRLP